MVPGALDATVGRVTGSDEIWVRRGAVSNRYGVTELRRVAWLAQSEAARRSWNSVLMRANTGLLSLQMPDAWLSGWAWAMELPAGLLVAELNGADVGFDLPHPDATLLIGQASRAIPRPASAQAGLPTFL